MRITIICENSAGPIAGTLGEHGFASLIETGDQSLLFDTGQGETLLHNAQRMNRNLHNVHTVALSHGHYDHAGGLYPLLRNFGKKDVYAHHGIFSSRYRLKDDRSCLSIGMPYQQDFLEGLGARFIFNSGWSEILPGIFLTGEVPRSNDFETGDKGLYCDISGCCPDTHPDDQSLVIRSEKGLILLLGCCHSGIINTMEYACSQSGINDVYAVIGGMHLNYSSKEQQEKTIHLLKRFGIRKIVGSHCTGFSASARLTLELPGIFQPGQVGFTLEV